MDLFGIIRIGLSISFGLFQLPRIYICLRTYVGANLMFALRLKTGNAPMSEINVFNYDHRFDLGFCLRANTRFASTFVLGRNYILGY